MAQGFRVFGGADSGFAWLRCSNGQKRRYLLFQGHVGGKAADMALKSSRRRRSHRAASAEAEPPAAAISVQREN